MASAVLLISTKGALSERKEKLAHAINVSLIFSTEIKNALLKQEKQKGQNRAASLCITLRLDYA